MAIPSLPPHRNRAMLTYSSALCTSMMSSDEEWGDAEFLAEAVRVDKINMDAIKVAQAKEAGPAAKKQKLDEAAPSPRPFYRSSTPCIRTRLPWRSVDVGKVMRELDDEWDRVLKFGPNMPHLRIDHANRDSTSMDGKLADTIVATQDAKHYDIDVLTTMVRAVVGDWSRVDAKTRYRAVTRKAQQGVVLDDDAVRKS